MKMTEQKRIKVIKAFTSSNGFTLLEVMVVGLIVAIIGAIAVPSYRQYIVQANRADAQDKLTEVMYQMERFATRNRQYTSDLTDLGYEANDAGSFSSNNGEYTITAAACGSGIGECVSVTATPIAGGRQVGDGALGLDSRGNRTGKWR